MNTEDRPDAGPRRGLRRLRALRWTAVAVVLAFATAPFAGFVYENRYDLQDVTAVLPWWLGTVAFSMAVLGLLLVATRTISSDRLALVVGVGVAGFYNFGRIAGAPDPEGSGIVRFAVVLVVVLAGVFFLGRLEPARRFVGLLGVMLAVLPLLGYVGWRMGTPEVAATAAAGEALPRPGTQGSTAPTSTDGPSAELAEAAGPAPVVEQAADAAVDQPDIYVFVLDERADAAELQRALGLDTSEFENGLRDLGFSVSPTSYTAYPKTILSLSSMFEMRYIATSPADIEGGLLQYSNYVEGDNAFFQDLREEGYEFIYSRPGYIDWFQCKRENADVCIEPSTESLLLSEVDRTIAEMTPLQLLTSETRPYTDPVFVLDHVERVATPGRPHVVFGHVLSPHGPFRYEEDCSLRDTFMEFDGVDNEIRKPAYAQDVTCIDQLTLQAVRSIVLRDPEAIIVLVSDHGSNFEQEGPTLADWSEAGLVERFGILDAVRAPGCALPEERGVLVNLMRRIQACLDGVEPELLPERAWVYFDDNPEWLEEIPDAATRLGSPGP